jgi:hypothetical protein
MDKEFLNKVVCQMVSETKINPTQSSITFPFPLSRFYRRMGNNVIDKLSFNPCSVNIYTYPFLFSTYNPAFDSTFSSSFSDHCKVIYSVKKEDEVYYMWKEYKICIDVLFSQIPFLSQLPNLEI